MSGEPTGHGLMGKLWQAVWLLLAVIILIGLAEQVVRAALPLLAVVAVIGGGVWLAVAIWRWRRDRW
jgi:hypothetical protein